MNKHTFEQRVFYADTDSYGIVWHGSYLRWMEMGRVYWTEMQGVNLENLRNDNDIVIPVAGINIKYKMSAKINDIMLVETELASFNGLSAVFKQVISNKETGKVFTDKKATLKAKIRIIPIEAVEDFDLEISLEDSFGETSAVVNG